MGISNKRLNIFRRVLVATSLALSLMTSIGSRPSSAEHLAVISPDEAGKQSFVLSHGINWYTNLEEAEAQARKEGKLVFWMHMLGTIDGAT